MLFENAVIKTEGEYDKALSKLGSEKETKEIIPLSVADIEVVHSDMIARYGGSDGIRDNGLLLSVVSAPYQTFGGEDLYPTLHDKAAKYLLDFARYQIFVDGNKRTALATASTFLLVNGEQMGLTNDEAYDLVMSIANGRITEIEQVSQVLEEKSIPLSFDNEIER